MLAARQAAGMRVGQGAPHVPVCTHMVWHMQLLPTTCCCRKLTAACVAAAVHDTQTHISQWQTLCPSDCCTSGPNRQIFSFAIGHTARARPPAVLVRGALKLRTSSSLIKTLGRQCQHHHSAQKPKPRRSSDRVDGPLAVSGHPAPPTLAVVCKPSMFVKHGCPLWQAKTVDPPPCGVKKRGDMIAIW